MRRLPCFPLLPALAVLLLHAAPAMALIQDSNSGNSWILSNVGIGTSTSYGALDVRPQSNTNFIIYGNSQVNGGSTSVLSSVNDANSATQAMEFYASAYDLAGGNVGVGVAHPNAPLDVETGTANGSVLIVKSPGTSGSDYGATIQMENTASGASSPYKYMRVSYAGDFQIVNSASTAVPFDLQDNGLLTINGPGTTCSIGNGTGATNCTSDRRLKKEIEPIPDALNKLAQIHGVTFHWKDPAKPGEHIGVIAQDVEKVFPQAVDNMPDKNLGTVKTVDIAALVAPLIEAVRELKSDDDELRAEFEAYKASHP